MMPTKTVLLVLEFCTKISHLIDLSNPRSNRRTITRLSRHKIVPMPHVALFSDRAVYNSIMMTLQFISEHPRNSESSLVRELLTFFLLNILHWLPQWFASIPNAHHHSAVDGVCDLLRNGIILDSNRPAIRAILRPRLEEYPAIFDRSVRNQLKRDAFLRAGIRQLNKVGFRKLSLNALSQELGVTRGAFYYYISDKDDLLERCFDRTCDTIGNALDRAKQDTHLDAIGVMEQTLRSLFEGHITDLDPLLRLNLLGAVSPAKRRAIEARLNKLRASFSEIIANAMVDGSARPIDLDALENLLMGTLFSASRWRLAATPLHNSWKPTIEPVTASAAYFEPLLTGYGRRS